MLVVARYVDGRVARGHSTDFHPDQDSFHIRSTPGVPPERITTDGLKGVFFVQSLGGNPEYRDHREFPQETGVRRKIWIEFMDGEKMAAWPVSAFLGKRGFYVLPTDQASNVEKAYIFRKAVRSVLQDREAEFAAAVESKQRRSSTIVQLVGRG